MSHGGFLSRPGPSVDALTLQRRLHVDMILLGTYSASILPGNSKEAEDVGSVAHRSGSHGQGAHRGRDVGQEPPRLLLIPAESLGGDKRADRV
jgi:hypothetical protein